MKKFSEKKKLDIFGLVIAPKYTPDEKSDTFDHKLHRLIISKEELNKKGFKVKLHKNIAETKDACRRKEDNGNTIF